ncbi:MAG TPA: pseudouridine synthase [Terriglobia bacterium]|nr:pseudouridine synthase [Terriglobia bacterium]
MQERLQKIISTAGIASRRKAEEFITQGRVSVNGKMVTVLGSKADPDRDHIRVNGKLIRIQENRVYLLLNKPPGYVSTLSDPENRPTVIALLNGIRERVYPVGRLDYASTGLLLLTNDGELANLMMSRASDFPRTYHVKLEGMPPPGGLEKLKQGIPLDGRRTAPAQIKLLASRTERARPWYEITLTEGRYHQVRRMFERIGQGVLKLKRVRIAFLTDEGLPLGHFRHLTGNEVARLKNWKPAGKQRQMMNAE